MKVYEVYGDSDRYKSAYSQAADGGLSLVKSLHQCSLLDTWVTVSLKTCRPARKDAVNKVSDVIGSTSNVLIFNGKTVHALKKVIADEVEWLPYLVDGGKIFYT